LDLTTPISSSSFQASACFIADWATLYYNSVEDIKIQNFKSSEILDFENFNEILIILITEWKI
jgi:hypothetical protein